MRPKTMVLMLYVVERQISFNLVSLCTTTRLLRQLKLGSGDGLSFCFLCCCDKLELLQVCALAELFSVSYISLKAVPLVLLIDVC